ncbi:MAG: hypothetical protein AAF467_04230 [Actinomycetota bacterium]
MTMRVARSALFAFVLAVPACSGGLSLSSGGDDDPLATITTPTTAASDATNDGADAASAVDVSDDVSDSGDGSEEGAGESSETGYTVGPRAARDDLTDPYCIDLEALFAAEHAYIDQNAPGYDFATVLAAYGTAAGAALDHAPAGHQEALQEAVDYATTYAGLSYTEAQAADGFEDAEAEFLFRFAFDWFDEDFEFDEDAEEDDVDLANYVDDLVAAHASAICGVDTDVSISFDFGDEAEFEFSTDGEVTIEYIERENPEADVIGCVVIDADTFAVSISNGSTESVSYSGEVWFYDDAGAPTGTRSDFDVSSVRPGELVGDWHDSWEETGASCELQLISGYSTSGGTAIDPADTCTFTPDGSTVDVTVSVVGPAEPASWLNVHYGLYDADGVRRHAGLTSVEYEPGQLAEETTFDFVDFEGFASCEIIAKERF